MSENQAYTEGQKLPGYLKIGIVDDEVYFQEQIYGILKKCEKCLKIRMDIRIFSSAEELMESLNEKEIFTAFFLDYRLGDDNGFALAEKIQAFLPDAFLIFVSSYSEKVFDAFRLKAFRFIPKTDMEKRISEAIGSICRELESVNTAYYVVATGQGMERICFRDILYVRKEGKYSVIVTKAGERRVRKSLKEISGELRENEFAYTARDYIVNLEHISGFSGNDVILEDDCLIPVSRERRKDLKQKIWDYYEQKRKESKNRNKRIQLF